MWLLFGSSVALAFSTYDEAQLLARVDEIAETRGLRVSTTAPALTKAHYRQAAAGKIVTGVKEVQGYSAKIGWGLGVFELPIEQLWAGINDEVNHSGLTPVDFTEIVSGKPCEAGRHVLMVMPVPVLSDRWWIVESQPGTALNDATSGQVKELTWHHVDNPESHAMSDAARKAADGGVIVDLSIGAWLLIALDETHTLAEYHTWANPGGNVPAGPASTFAAGGIDQTFKAMDKYARTHKPLQCMGR
jgi:hypothetical protein